MSALDVEESRGGPILRAGLEVRVSAGGRRDDGEEQEQEHRHSS